jgi:ABC-type transport system involved in multi-copper enzyme maturation permease subunit
MPRPFQHGFFGPLFGYDLVASTRRGQHLGLRLLVAIVLLGGLYLLYAGKGFDPFEDTSNRKLSPKEMANLAEGFAATVMGVQFAMVLLLTPPLVGEAIAREKERRTLEFLFVTELTNWEIVTGKLVARLAYLVGVLLTCLPVLALTQLFGGIDPVGLLASYVGLLTMTIAVGSVCMLMSVWARTALEATVCSYFVAGFYGFFSTGCIFPPIFSVDHGVPMLLMMGTIGHVFVSLACVGAATRELRARAVPPERSRTPDSAAPLPKRKPELAPLVRAAPAADGDDTVHLVVSIQGLRRRPPRRPPPRVSSWDRSRAYKPPVGPQPLLWKELYFHALTRDLGPATREVLIALAGILTLCVLIIWLSIFSSSSPSLPVDAQYAINGIVRFFTVVFAGILGLGVIAHTAGSISRERENDTLIGLLSIPEPRATILEAKWLAGFLSLRGLMIALVFVWLLGLLTAAIHPVSLVWLILTVAAPLQCIASLGIWLSVLNKTTLRANLAAVLCILLIAAGPWLVMNYVEWLSPYGPRLAELSNTVTTALMPPVAWVRSAVTWEDYEKFPKDIRDAMLLGALGYACFAWVLWKDACRRFGREKLGKN